MQELGFTVVSWQAKVEMLIKAITDDLLNQSQSVHLRNIVTVSEEGEEREEVEGGSGEEKEKADQEMLPSTKCQMCEALRGVFRVIAYSDFKDKSIL